MSRDTAFKVCVAVLLGMAMLTVGCRRRRGISQARMARYTRNLVEIAARDTGCADERLAAHQIASNPAVFTVTGCAQPVEYWLECRHACRWRNVATLNEAASMSMRCAPEGIQQRYAQAPNVRYAAGCGRIQSFTVICNGEACGWAPTGPPQATTPEVQRQPAVVVPSAPQAPGAVLQTQIQQQREAILSCIDSPSLTLRLRWTADGQVIVQMPQELLGTAAEGCLQALLGGLRVAAEASGEVVVPIQ